MPALIQTKPGRGTRGVAIEKRGQSHQVNMQGPALFHRGLSISLIEGVWR